MAMSNNQMVTHQLWHQMQQQAALSVSSRRKSKAMAATLYKAWHWKRSCIPQPKQLDLSENVGYIPNEIAIFHRDNDQQNHWVQWGTQHFQTHPTGFVPPEVPRAPALFWIFQEEFSEALKTDASVHAQCMTLHDIAWPCLTMSCELLVVIKCHSHHLQTKHVLTHWNGCHSPEEWNVHSPICCCHWCLQPQAIQRHCEALVVVKLTRRSTHGKSKLIDIRIRNPKPESNEGAICGLFGQMLTIYHWYTIDCLFLSWLT